MKIIVDGYGGDHAPLAVLEGCAAAVRELHAQILLTGDPDALKKTAAEHQISLAGITLVPADGVIDIEDDPMLVCRDKKNCSMGVGFELLSNGEGDAFVSAGSTAALVVGATMRVKRIKGIKRAALAPILPTDSGCYILLDGGANLDCRPEMLLQFAIMGSIYMNRILHIEKPRVGLINIGSEETKGGDLQLAAYRLLSQAPIHFAGNAEARDLACGAFDVAVADGFTGNVVLKLTEGVGLMMSKNLKDIFKSSLRGKLSALMLMKPIQAFKKKMDYTEYGGAPLLGIKKPVIKAHGSSNANAFKHAIRQAMACVEQRVTEEIANSLREEQEHD